MVITRKGLHENRNKWWMNTCVMCRYLLENLNGDRTPDESLAAHPKAFLGCSISGCKAISVAEKEKGCVYLSTSYYNKSVCGNVIAMCVTFDVWGDDLVNGLCEMLVL